MSAKVTKGLEAAEDRRERLRALMDRLEAALAEPAPPDLHEWRARVSDVVGELDDEFRSHVADTEGPGGLFEEVIATAPRLASHAERVRDEHPALHDQLAQLRTTLDDPGTADAIREAGLALLTALIAHRQHGADLLYEAYWVDVGGLSG